MAKNTFLDWDTTAGNNTDIGGIGILGTNNVNNFDDAFRTAMAQLRSGVDGEVVYAAKSGNYTAVLNDNNAWHRYTATATVSLTAAATLGANWHYYVQANGGAVTIDPNGAETINGATTLLIQDGQTASIICTGSAFIAVVEGTVITGPGQQGYLFGLTLSNNGSDATNDIDIAAGVAAADTSPYYLMQLTSTLTKRLDAAWAVGSGNGGLDTGAIADGTYHMWLIQRSDTGVVDALFSASATSPTMPTSYDRKRRIGSILRESAAIVSFRQFGDVFERAAVSTLSSTAGFAATVINVNVPSGISVQPMLSSVMTVNLSSLVSFGIGSGWVGTTNRVLHNVQTDAGGAQSDAQLLNGGVFTNTSRQIYMSRTVTSGSVASHSINTNGWIDTRGRI